MTARQKILTTHERAKCRRRFEVDWNKYSTRREVVAVYMYAVFVDGRRVSYADSRKQAWSDALAWWKLHCRQKMMEKLEQ